MTYILHLETSTKVCSVALSENGKLIAVKENLSADYSHSENLTVFIQEILVESKRTLKEINAISVTSGPGSYTGLRIGVSTAKGLCYALGIPLISVDALISLASIAVEKNPNKNLCALIDARRMEEFSAIYNENLQLIKPISADIIDESTYSEFEPFIYFGDGALKLQDIWKNRNCEIDISIHSSASGQISHAFKKFQLADFENVAYFEPFYLKDFMSKNSKP
jgi:tRNA threonylcarbamoyladenosine biosynthesis protein TsaB